MCFGCSKEPSHRDCSFEYPQHMFWLSNKKKTSRVNVGTFGQCRYNPTLLYFLDNFSVTLVVIAMCNQDKSQ